MKKLLEAVVCVAVVSCCMAAQSDEQFIARCLGKTHFRTFSRATELEKQRYLNMIRARGGVEEGAPWIPTTKPPAIDLKDID